VVLQLKFTVKESLRARSSGAAMSEPLLQHHHRRPEGESDRPSKLFTVCPYILGAPIDAAAQASQGVAVFASARSTLVQAVAIGGDRGQEVAFDQRNTYPATHLLTRSFPRAPLSNEF
jgi:hypothetical protein